jgi:hypothetical protein
MRNVVVILLLGSFALLIIGSSVDSFAFKFEGLTGLVLEKLKI